jgi:hypothetical protein
MAARKSKRVKGTRTTGPGSLRLLLPNGPLELSPPAGTRLQRAAMQWSYIVRNRRRWAEREALAREQNVRARALLREVGVGDDELRAIAEAGKAQVSIGYSPTDDDAGWELRVLPWEFLLAGATQKLRSKRPLAVARQLGRRVGSRERSEGPKSVLYVQSAPQPLADEYDFASEQELVKSNLSQLGWNPLLNPTRKSLQEAMRSLRPDVVHLAGFDSHEARRLAPKAPLVRPEGAQGGSDERVLDGYALSGSDGELDLVSARDLAELLAGRGHAPLFVGCGFWDSGSRVAATLVASGVSTAVGFQDSFDDELAELFFAALYRRWQQAGWRLADAFHDAWDVVRQRPRGLTGTGVVLWSSRALVGPDAGPTARERTLRQRFERESRAVIDQREHRLLDQLCRVHCEPFEELNYSLLHNRRPLFDTLKILKLMPGCMEDIELRVELDGGAATFPYRRIFSLRDEKLDLNPDIHASLTSSLARSAGESVNTSLFVELLWGPRVLYRQTHRVRLLPPDQWRDTDEDRLWLPSFVLPRDPAVTELIEKATRYVRVLRDDPRAGFEGYQAVDAASRDPSRPVDLQVQAIWDAIVHEWRLAYVNPPPAYSQGLDSQRLRTPSMIAADGAGTCIDLCLLVSACLELVDIYPVVFLLDDHAFPGYWRSEEAHDDFLQVIADRIEELSPSDAVRSGTNGTQTEPWLHGPDVHAEIWQRVKARDLVALESVNLTDPTGFAVAIQNGRKRLRPRTGFNSMIDVVSARYANVTPLPLAARNALDAR